MIFCPNLSSLLLVGLPNNTVESFDVEERKFATWARPYFQSISSKLTHFREPLIGVAVSPSSDQNETGQSFVFWALRGPLRSIYPQRPLWKSLNRFHQREYWSCRQKKRYREAGPNQRNLKVL